MIDELVKNLVDIIDPDSDINQESDGLVGIASVLVLLCGLTAVLLQYIR